MNYPSLSLKQNLIDEVFTNKECGSQKELKQTTSLGSSKRKKRYKEQKELRLQNVTVEECDQCEFKTTKFQTMRHHKRVKHSGVRQRCTGCEYSHVYPNRVKIHFKQVHMGIKRGIGLDKCRRELCEFAGTTNCLELENHSFFFCKQCQLSFARSDSFKYHKSKIHEGLASNKSRKPRFCKEEGCTYIDFNGELKRHIETKHEGIVRFKCHAMNCSFGSSQQRELRRHARTHEMESSKVSAK